MVSLPEVQASNSRIVSSLPSGLVAVFVGGTRGIGETAVKQFAKHVRQPRVYIIGRSQVDAEGTIAECKKLNAEGEYIFIKADVSLIRAVDDVCKEIKSKEKAINVLFLTTGTLIFKKKTSEGLDFALALTYYSRTRFIVNLLPLLQQGISLRRVVSVFNGTNEGLLDIKDIPGRKVSMIAARGHLASLITTSLETLAKKAPDVSFIHSFPGPVKTDLAKDATGVAMSVLRGVFAVIGPFVNMPYEECGERHLFLATSARYPPSTGVEANAGVALEKGLTIARGTKGESGSGVYSVNAKGESAGPKVEQLLAGFRKDGVVENVWDHTVGEFKRIMGTEPS